jgi:hypothetical protein
MPTFKVKARQYVEEVAYREVEADTEQEARDLAEKDDDWDWEDGDGSLDGVEIVLVKEIVAA